MLGLSLLGVFHTIISLVALGSAVVSLVQHREIAARTLPGKIYIGATAITCATAFGLHAHAAFGPGHALAVLTLLVLAAALLAGATAVFGGASTYVQTVGYSATVLFNLIPAIAETATRLPADAPLASGPDSPIVKATTGVVFLLFLLGAFLQVRRLRARPGASRAVMSVSS